MLSFGDILVDAVPVFVEALRGFQKCLTPMSVDVHWLVVTVIVTMGSVVCLGDFLGDVIGF